jgi:hypothetical protein
MRHEEYIKDKKSYTSARTIALLDKKYKNKYPSAYRECVFIQRQVTFIRDKEILQCGADVFHLINLDSFFEFDKNRKDIQMSYVVPPP